MNTSHSPPPLILLFSFSTAITVAHFLLSILKPQSADLQNLLTPASPTSAIVALGTYYSIAILLWTSLQSHSSFFSGGPSAIPNNDDKEKEPNAATAVQKATSHYLIFLGIAFAASLVVYQDIFRVWYRAVVTAWSFSYSTPNPDTKLKVVSHVVFCQTTASMSITAGIVSLFPGYAIGHILFIGREARVEFVVKLHQPVEKPWRKREKE